MPNGVIDLTTTTLINAHLGEKILQNVDKYFSGSPSTIAVELFQNARRAGATRIDVTTGPDGSIIFRDNGTGLSHDKANVLLAFGSSSNNGTVEYNEDPAGMGFFSLSNHHVTVSSRDWLLDIPPGAFINRSPATLTRNPPGPRPDSGMTITVDKFASTKSEARTILAAVAKGISIDTFVDGEPVEYVPFETYTKPGPDGARITRRAHGCTITAIRWTGDHDIARQYRASRNFDMMINIFGQVHTFANHSELKEYLPEISGETIESTYIVQKTTGAEFSKITPYWRIAIDIENTSVITPRLPARDGIVLNEGWKLIRQEIEDVIAELASQLDPNGIHNLSPIRKFAETAGRTIPAQRIAISSGLYNTNYGSWGQAAELPPSLIELRDGDTVIWREPEAPEPAQCLVRTPLNRDVNQDSNIVFAIINSGSAEIAKKTYSLIEDHPTFDLSTWNYEEVEDITAEFILMDGTSVTTSLTFDTSKQETKDPVEEALRPHLDGKQGIAVSDIRIVISGNDGKTRIELPARTFVWAIDEEYGEIENLIFAATPAARIHEIVRHLMDVHSWYSDDYEAGSYDQQKNYIDNELHTIVEQTLRGPHDAIANEIRRKLGDVFFSIGNGSRHRAETIERIVIQRKDDQYGLLIETTDGKAHAGW